MMICGIGVKVVLFAGNRLKELMRPFLRGAEKKPRQPKRMPEASITYYPSRKKRRAPRSARSQ